MMNTNPLNKVDSPAKPQSQQEKKTFVNSTYTWFGLIAFVACIPVFNFMLVPLMAIAGIIAFTVYYINKRRNLHLH